MSVFAVQDWVEGPRLEFIRYYFFFLFPIFGVLITLLIVGLLSKGNLNKGVPFLLYSIGRNSSRIPGKHRYLNALTSVFTVGFGGSVGLEAPVLVTGSAWGSWVGKFFHLNSRYTTVLVGCGAASALAAIFNSPIAGVIFVLEVLVSNANVTFLISLLISSLMGTLVAKFLVDERAIFEFTNIDAVQNTEYVFFILLGLIAGYFSIFFHQIISNVQYRFGHIRKPGLRFLLSAIGLGVIILILPSLYGEGYWTLKLIIEGKYDEIVDTSLFTYFGDAEVILIGYLLLSMMFKGVATGLTRAAGGTGGVFAPSMFAGGIMGFVFASLLNQWWPELNLSVVNFTLVGMAGVASGILHSPLTIIFLIAEIVQGYELLVPLMIVSTLAYSINIWVMKHSWYTRELANRGDYIVHDRDKTILSDLKVHSLIERNFKPVNINDNLRALVDAVSQSERNIFPVLNDDRELEGVILLNDVRQLIFKPELYDQKKISEISHAPPDIVEFNESMERVMERFDKSEAWNLPVVKNGKYVGFLSRSKIFSLYRKQLQIRAQEIG
jgi:CIC family chloride channel protein